ncbi:MAG: CHASE domain-containing protein, partial [Pseudomonadales bacterium]|nr:CHASE domain-containing protein [Pseudomonadales bacterium]
SVSQRAADRFVFEVNTSVQAITKRMQEYEQVLRGGVGLFMASEHVDRKEFQTYVANLLIDTYWPGIQGIGYAQMISPDSLTAHEKSIRSEGFPDYMVYPPGERDVYSAIVYLEPFTSRNQRAFGYDMFSNPIRKEAMQKAAETGQPAVSGLVTLVQETSTDIQAGFLVYLPLYSVDKPLATEEERWRLLKGFVYAPFRAKDLFQGILGEGPPTLDFQVFDGDQPLTDHLLYDSRQDTLRRDEGGQHQSQRVIALQGRAWTLQFKSTQTFDQLMGSTQPTIIATTGLIIDILLFVVIYTMARNRENAVQRTKEITLLVEGLSSSEQRLKRTHEIAKLGSWQYDLKRKKFGCSDQAYRILELATDAPINYKRYMEVIHPEDR